MKRTLSLLSLVLALAVLLTACSSPSKTPPVEEVFTGTSAETMEELLETMGLDIMKFTDEVTAENVNGLLGLTSADFDKYVINATSSVAAIMTHAHLVAAIACHNPADAKTVKDLIAKGFDSSRWICVFPEECFVVDVGSYVFLVASTAENAATAKDALQTLAGDAVGDYNVFFTGMTPNGDAFIGTPAVPSVGDTTTEGTDDTIKLS
jgi:hypothetical protein